MKRKDSLAEPRRPRLLPVAARCKFRVFVLVLLALPLTFANGARLKQARVTQVVQDVKLLPGQAAPRPAKVSDEVREGTAVRTGTESRSELSFADQTLARLGANTIFSFNEGTRNLELGGGAMLLRVPKDAGGAQINTGAVTAAITGTTVMLEYHPNAYIKFIILEGTGRIFRKGHLGESVLLHAGQMLIVNPNGKGLPDPVDVDLDRLTKTSLLIVGFPPLPSLNLIAREIGSQDERKSEGGLIQTNLVIFGAGTTVSLLDPTNVTTVDQANSNEARQAIESPAATPSVTPTATMTPTPTETMTPTPTPVPTPSKEGTPSVISSPVPYVIGSGTTITTDPSITTNGVTDFGKIYNGPSVDGTPSDYFFGTTTAFDTSSGFNALLSDPRTLPVANFKFLALELAGNPTISLANGGAVNLALISVGDITSSTPGGSLTFAGINALLLATENGSITLGSEISFDGIPALLLYARGVGSTLTLDSTVTGTTNLALASEGDIDFNNAFNFTETGATLNGFHVLFDANVNLTASSGLTITLDNSNGGDLGDQEALISLQAGQDMTANGDAGLNLTIANNGGGHIGSEAAIDLFTGGNLTASALTFLINSRDAGSIDGGASILLDATGAVNVTNDAEVVISTRNDGLGDGTIDGGASIVFDAASVSTGGFMDLALSANAGGTLSSATILANVPGAVVTTGGYSSEIQSTGFNVPGGPFVQGGMITGAALLTLNFGSVSSGDFFDIEIDNFGQGTIGGEALLSVGVTGDLNATGDIFTDIINTAVQSGEAIIPGGTINGNATVNVGVGGDIITSGVGEFAVLNNDLNFLSQAGTIMGDALVLLRATNITTGGFFQPLINNTNGFIGGDATISVIATGDINVGAETFFNILNTNGTIGGSALMNMVARNFTTGTTFQAQILNDGGSIGAGALLSAIVSGAQTIGGDATIQIGNSGGSIGLSADIFLGGNISTGGLLFTEIDNPSGNITGGATLDVGSLGGDINTQGGATFQILNTDFGSGGGNIGGDAAIFLIPANFSSGGDLNAGIFSGGGATIAGTAFVSLTVGDVTVAGAASIQIDNAASGSGPGSIGSDATIIMSVTNFAACSLLTLIDNSLGGTIGGAATLNLNVAGSLTSTGDAFIQITNGAGTIGGDAMIDFAAGSFSAASLTLQITNLGGTIGGESSIIFDVGDVAISGDTAITIDNSVSAGGGLLGSEISSNATIDLSAGDVSASMFLQVLNQRGGVLGGDATINLGAASVVTTLSAGLFGVTIGNYDAGSIGGNALIDVNVSGEISAPSEVEFSILNNDIFGGGGGTIGSDATVAVSATDISTAGVLFAQVLNSGGGFIGGGAAITLTLSGAMDSGGDVTFEISNGSSESGVSTISGDATIDITAATSAVGGTLNVLIDNTGGSIGGSATINTNFSGNATVTNDATLEILGSDAAAAAAINLNGGSYDAGGTFLALIDGDGAITFNNASVHADVLKVGALGTNGVLNIGGGTLSGDTTLKLYASGSNGSIDFVANATLSSQSTAAIVAANTVTLDNGVVVTITGTGGPAQVFANVPNYTGSGGNGSTSGIFNGNGATTQPLDQAPPFDSPSDSSVIVGATAPGAPDPVVSVTPGSNGDTSNGGSIAAVRGKRRNTLVTVRNTNELLDLADKVTAAPTESARGTSAASVRRMSHNRRTDLPTQGLPRSGGASSPDSIRNRGESARVFATR
jgi:hypothetical protein